MSDEGDAAVEGRLLHPLLGFSCGVIDGSVGLQIEAAVDQAQLAARAGETAGYVLTPDAAIELGKALQERGRMAREARGLRGAAN